MDIDDFFDNVKFRFESSESLKKGDIKFLIDAVSDYVRDEGYWPGTLVENYKKGKYN